MLASSLAEQPPGQPIWGPDFAFLFVTLCVYIYSVCGYHYITHTVALQRGLLLWIHPHSCKVGPTRIVLIVPGVQEVEMCSCVSNPCA